VGGEGVAAATGIELAPWLLGICWDYY
jgi:hypothetical protein